jgi:hypothetical protein
MEPEGSLQEETTIAASTDNTGETVDPTEEVQGDVPPVVPEPEAPAAPEVPTVEQFDQLTQQVSSLTQQLVLAQQQKPVEAKPPTPPEPQLTREELDIMREDHPHEYERWMINEGKKAALAQFNAGGSIEERVQRENANAKINEKFNQDFTEYSTDPRFKADVDYVMNAMGGTTPVHRMAAASLVKQYRADNANKKEQKVAAAKIQGAREEAERAKNANQAVSPGTPQPAKTTPAVDPYYQKYASRFGLSAEKLQERENAILSKSTH